MRKNRRKKIKMEAWNGSRKIEFKKGDRLVLSKHDVLEKYRTNHKR